MSLLSQLCHAIDEIALVVLLRFPPLVRVWALLVVTVNAVALAFLPSIYAVAALLAVGVGLMVMAVIYVRLGFVRLLGIGHALWIPMLPWMYLQLPHLDRGSNLYLWLVCLLVLNSLSLTVDVLDVVRFIAGDRSPHYAWDESIGAD